MNCSNIVIFLSIFCVNFIETSRILICVPCPSVSHQFLFYPLVKELVNRGHEVVFITTDPIYPKGKAPANLTEIDTHDISYAKWKQELQNGDMVQGDKNIQYKIMSTLMTLLANTFELQMQTAEVQELIKNKTHFDLLIIEASSKSAQALSHVFKAPMILMSSLGGFQDNYIAMGAPIYPKLLYPTFWQQKMNNMTIMDKIKVLWDTYKIEKFLDDLRIQEDESVKRLFGPDTPPLEELGRNAQMLLLNIYPIWEFNRPVPPGIVFIGGIHQIPHKKLPEDLKSYLESSEKGVVYFSLGTNVSPSTLAPEKIETIAKGLARLKYDVLIRWDSNYLPGKGSNTKIVKWIPQSDLLRHPKIKAFVTQGGLQSFDEALAAGVPLVGIPMLGDQWYNVERFVALHIGVGITEHLTEDLLVNAIETVVEDPSYRHNIITLRNQLHDQPQSALDRAVWSVEHVIRHKGAAHLRAPAANMSWADYLDIELIAVMALAALIILATVASLMYLTVKIVVRCVMRKTKLKVA